MLVLCLFSLICILFVDLYLFLFIFICLFIGCVGIIVVFIYAFVLIGFVFNEFS